MRYLHSIFAIDHSNFKIITEVKLQTLPLVLPAHATFPQWIVLSYTSLQLLTVASFNDSNFMEFISSRSKISMSGQHQRRNEFHFCPTYRLDICCFTDAPKSSTTTGEGYLIDDMIYAFTSPCKINIW